MDGTLIEMLLMSGATAASAIWITIGMRSRKTASLAVVALSLVIGLTDIGIVIGTVWVEDAIDAASHDGHCGSDKD